MTGKIGMLLNYAAAAGMTTIRYDHGCFSVPIPRRFLWGPWMGFETRESGALIRMRSQGGGRTEAELSWSGGPGATA